MNFQEFLKGINQDIEEKMSLLDDKERELFEDILLGVINRKIRGKIYNSEAWVDGMNKLMGQMRTSSGIRLSLKWKSKHAEHEGQLDTGSRNSSLATFARRFRKRARHWIWNTVFVRFMPLYAIYWIIGNGLYS